MAIKNLTLNEMVQISDTMSHPESPARARLQASPVLAVLVSPLEEAHQTLLRMVPTPENPRLQELSAEAATVDAIHDALATSTYNLLTSTANLVDDGAPYLELRDQLLPSGVVGATHLTYEGQAGYAKRLRANLTDAQRTQLASIRVGTRNLMDVVSDWMEAGERIGQLDQERQQLAQASEAPSAATVSAARFQWIRVVNAIRMVADVADLSDEDHATIFGALNELEVAADQRAARRRAAKVEADIAAEVEASAAAKA